ncbi:MAG: insulinase family protein [candidate division Zixibacteria bacterium]|nr:insulinase family protein [candidate division Zixibacteria bacterium]
MKKILFISVISLVGLLLTFTGCGRKKLSLDAEGYGKTTLANGITVLVNHDETTRLTAARFLVGGGVLTETAENNGITNLMLKMLLKGNDSLAAGEITERLDFLGANISVVCFKDYGAISFTSLTENFEQVLEIISQSFLSPTFSEEELAKLKHEVEGDLKAVNDDQTQASSRLFWQTAFGDRGYGLYSDGTLESIAAVTVEDIKAHYRKYVGGKNMIFSIATDLSPEEVALKLDRYLGGIKADAEKVPTSDMTLQPEKEGFVSFDRNQSFVFMGYMLGHLKPVEVAYLDLVNRIMGTGVGSRLWSLRQVEKLAYAVYSQYDINKYDAVFRAAIGTDTAKVKQALTSLNREWNRLIEEGLSGEELATAKVNMKNGLIYRIDTKANRANNMAYYEYIGYGYRFVLDLIEKADGVTLEEVNKFIKDNLTPDREYISIVGKK